MKIIKSLLRNNFVKGGAFFTASSFLVSFFNYLFNLLAARKLGPQNYGEIIALFSYISIFSVPTQVISIFLVQKIASSGDNKFTYAFSLETFLWERLKKWWFIFPLSLLTTPFIPQLTNLSLITSTAVLPLILISFIATAYASLLQGLNLLILFSLTSIFAGLIKLSGTLFAANPNGLLIIIIFIMLSSVLSLGVMMAAFNILNKKQQKKSVVKIENRLSSLLFNRQFTLILLSTLALNLLNNFDILYVKKYLPSTEAGIYASWSLFAKIILYAIGPLISVSFIFFSGEKKGGQKVFRLSLVFLLFIGILSYIAYTFFSSTLVNFFFGNKFISVLPYLSSAAIFGSLYTILNFVNNYYVARKSKVSLVIPILIPIYMVVIFFVGRNISEIILLNIFFSLAALLIHAVIYIKEELNFNLKSL